MGHVFVPHFGEPCRSFILGNVSWYVDASGAALHVTWRVLEKRASEQNTVLIRQKKRIAVISTCMRSPPYIIIIIIVIIHNRGRATRAASPASARTRRTLRSLSCTTGASCISWVSVRHEDHTSGR